MPKFKVTFTITYTVEAKDIPKAIEKAEADFDRQLGERIRSTDEVWMVRCRPI